MSLVTVESSCTHTRGVINVSDQCGTFIQPFHTSYGGLSTLACPCIYLEKEV